VATKFVVPRVCRFTVNGHFMDRKVANVIDMTIDTTGVITNRADAISDQCGVLLNQWHTDILPSLSILYFADSVSWLDLNSEDGSVGSRTTSGGHTWPAAGGDSLSPMPGNVSALVHKSTTSARGARQGRMYLPGVTEPETQSTTPNTLDPTVVTALNTKLSAFLGNINQSSPGDGYSSDMVVVHILTRAPLEPGQKPPGSPATGNSSKVSGMTVDTRLATQRRRLRG
jgi:hypothetical protein